MDFPAACALFAISPNIDYIFLYKFVIFLSHLHLLSHRGHATIIYILESYRSGRPGRKGEYDGSDEFF